MNMTDEEMRIAIAEACGWTEIVQHKIHAGNEGLLGTHTAVDGVSDRDWVPDYLNDLNAMHEAEEVLGPKDYEAYRWTLWEQVKRPLVSEWHRAHLSATARQRAIAFIKTLNLEPK